MAIARDEVSKLRNEAGIEKGAELLKREYSHIVVLELDADFNVVDVFTSPVLIDFRSRRKSAIFGLVQELNAFLDRMPCVSFRTQEIRRVEKALLIEFKLLLLYLHVLDFHLFLSFSLDIIINDENLF